MPPWRQKKQTKWCHMVWRNSWLLWRRPCQCRNNHVDYRDNCATQNKNWTLFSALVYEFNQIGNSSQSRTIKYFENGHTFMAANFFHKAMENELQKYNFNDFVKGKSYEMKYSDFRRCTKKVCKANYPKLQNIWAVRFKRGSTKMEWKSELRGSWSSWRVYKKLILFFASHGGGYSEKTQWRRLLC